MHFVCASDCGGRLADITQLDFFEFNFASLLAPTDGLCSLASASAGMCVAAEQVAKQSVVEIAARVRMQNLARLGMHASPWRVVYGVWSKCVLWLRADAVRTEAGAVVAWESFLGGPTLLPTDSARSARPLQIGGYVRFSGDGGAAMGTVGSPWSLDESTLLVAARAVGDCTIADGRVSRYELAHGYPVDRVRENPRICFTASADGDPPARALWGSTRSSPNASNGTMNALWRCYTVTVRNRRRIRTPGCRPTSTCRFGGCLGCREIHDPTEPHTAGRRAFLHVNGTLESSGDPGRNPLTGITLGGDHTGQFTLNGDIAACVLFRGALPDNARRVLEVHLRRLAAQAAPRPTTA